MASDEDMANARPIVDVPSDGAGETWSRGEGHRGSSRGRGDDARHRAKRRAPSMERSASDPASRYSSPTQRVFFCVCRHIIVSDRLSRAELFWATHVTRVGFHYPRRAPALAGRATLPCRRAPSPPPSRRLASHRCGSRAFARTLSRAPPRARVAARASNDASDPSEATVSSVSSDASAASSPSPPPYAGPPRVVVIGGGFGGLYTALKLDALDGWKDGLRPRVTLVDRAERFVFKPLLYELVNETMKEWEVCPTFEDLLAPTDIAFHRGDVASVRPDAGDDAGGVVRLADGTHLAYDYLVVGAGTVSSVESVPGAKDHAVPLSTLEDAQRLAGALRDAETKRLRSDSNPATYEPSFAVVGGGLSGVELAGVVAERMRAAEGKLEGGTPRLERGNHAGIPGGTERSGDATVGILRGDDSRRREGDEGGRGDDARSARAPRAPRWRGPRRAKNVSTSSTSCAGPSDKKSNRRRRGRSRGRTVEKFSPTRRFASSDSLACSPSATPPSAATRPRRRTILSPVVTWPRRLTPRLRPARPCRAPRRWRSSRRITRRGTCGLPRLVGRSCRFVTSTSAT